MGARPVPLGAGRLEGQRGTPRPRGFDEASQYTRPEDVAAAIPCGNDVDAFVDAVRPYADAGFTEIALVQIGGYQQEPFLDRSATKLLPALGEL